MKSATNANQNTKKESHPMMTQQTLTQLRSLKLSGMADALQQALSQVVQCAQLCVQRSGLPTVDAVYLTGGSSALRPLMQALRTAMPHATVVEGNRFGGVAAGLAVCGATWSD